MKKYVLNSIIGMGFGFPITLLCMILIGGYNPVMKEFLVWMAASALYGVLSTIMDEKKFDMPLPASIGLHFFGCVAITMGAAWLCGYVSSIANILPILIPATGIYAVVYLVCFFLMKQEEKAVNKALEKK